MTKVEEPMNMQSESFFDSAQAKKLAAKTNASGKSDSSTNSHTTAITASQWIVDNQIAWASTLLAAVYIWNYVIAGGESAMVQLQYKIPGDPQGRYSRGWGDAYYIMRWVLIFTAVRVIAMYWVLEPFAQWYGVRSKRKVTRFGEQGWLTIYYLLSNSAGIYVMYGSPYWMNTKGFWTNYPEGHKQMTPLMKSYYLIQLGFWFQQVFVLLIEERRKDFLVMLTHHIITCNLLCWSLYMNFTRIGNAILCCMDSSDIFLSGTKCTRYLGFERAAVASFVVFILSWVYTRHYLYFKIMYSIAFESTSMFNNDIWDPSNGSFYSYNVISTFGVFLALLQLLIIYWFVLVLRIIYRIIFYSNLDDTRSDSEDNDDKTSTDKKALASNKSKTD
ncbi:Sphingosine N-acyltransferase lag1 [Coemansia sp. RSA 1813]|nr:Sphingosine N-acyltransferase lag1 [Coemansia sp. RSA 1646]KAJ1772136.1 Sphingosine N-acyltransferase lag1 [Coemansia sp. RSA 1843]KAJ2091745.1 Sphingosine N-acyltransferase lag1 [Coemansia sp. RSA 986]KAJ2216851.1 Sphingosine N-acyltransferase lag1 [Coemansia sp. RSA 487]KAJ2571853.1 Sphingosine N-acyltransferase lag1 [Coemansia sp. RSA 1813]